MDITDYILMLLYGFLAILVVFSISRIYRFNEKECKYFKFGIVIKVFGAIGFLLIYEYYFKYGGDAYSYYLDAIGLNRLLLESPYEFINYAFGNAELKDLWSDFANSQINNKKGTKEFFVTVLISFITLLGFGNYYASTVVFAFISFFGYWLLYKALSIRYPEISFWAFVCVFCLPSGIIWGSGMVKENMVLSLLGVFFYSINRITVSRKIEIKSFILILLSIALIAKVKVYVVASLMPAFLIWISFNLLRTNDNIAVRKILRPIIIIGLLLLSLLSMQLASSRVDALSVDSFIGKAQSFQDWHYVEGKNTSDQHGRGSSYTLGSYSPTFLGAMSKVPASINVTYFRPYPWEVKSPIVALVSLESMIVLFLVLFVLSRRQVYHDSATIFGDSFLILLLIYSLILGYLVGFTSYNFGALDRYKIPAMPFFLFSMAIILYRVKVSKNLLEQQ